jgi:hypothetical protein
MKIRCLAMIVLSVAATSVGAQCKVDEDSNEAKLLAYYAVPLAFSPSGTLESMPKGSIRLGFELTYIPEPDDELRHTSICFLPKEENAQLSPVLPRPRVSIGLPGGFFVEGTYLPPVTVADATPNMGSIAVGLVRPWTGSYGVSLRAHGTFGSVKGPITCPSEALQLTNPNAACYGSSPSDDTYRPNILGIEGAVTWSGSSRYAAYAGAGYSSLRPRFQVGFQPANAPFDSTRVEVDLDRISLMLGGRWHATQTLALAGEVYAVPEDVVTFRLGGTWRIR